MARSQKVQELVDIILADDLIEDLVRVSGTDEAPVFRALPVIVPSYLVRVTEGSVEGATPPALDVRAMLRATYGPAADDWLTAKVEAVSTRLDISRAEAQRVLLMIVLHALGFTYEEV